MNCPSCGTPNNEGAKFCENCGTPLIDVEQTETVIEEQATEQIPDPIGQTEEIPNPAGETQQIPEQPAGSAFEPGATQQMPQQPAPPAGPPVVPEKSSGLAIGALVCGIVAIFLFETIILGIILGIVAIILAVQSNKKGPDGKAKAGKICGIVGIVLSAVMLIITIVTGCAVFNFVSQNPSVMTYLSTSSSSSAPSSKSSTAPSSTPKSTAPQSSSSAASSNTGSTSTYTNSRFGYALHVPSGFTKTAEGANGDGATFENKSLNMTAMVSGTNNSNGLTAEKYIETKWNGTPDSMSESDGNVCMLYQVEGNTATFYYAYVGAGSINELKITYPASSNDSAQLNAAEMLIGGFEPGSIASTH